MIDEGRIIAWLDGELDAADADEVAAAVAADPSLAAYAEAQRRLATRLQSAFSGVLAQDLPLSLARAAAPAAGASRWRIDAARRLGPPVWAGLAAAVVLAFAAGYAARWAAPGRILAERDGRLVAAGALAHALDTQLASAPPPGSRPDAVRVLLTFRAHDQRVCRSWTTAGVAGVACRAGQDWMIAATAAAPSDAGEYRMASAGDPTLLAIVASMVETGPFDAPQEAQLRRRAWR